jgi:hypothetical protein
MSKETIFEECNVTIIAREGGKIISKQEGHNVWTNTGREYSCLLKSLDDKGRRYRSDAIAYIGVGGGTQIESPSVIRLVRPLRYSGNLFLKRIDNSLTVFPDNGSRLSIRYSAVFGPQSFNQGGGVTYISECGLYTNGHAISFEPDMREAGIDTADEQAPVAYHTFEPIPKTSNIEIEIMWELRH